MSVDLSKRSTSAVQFITTAKLIQKNCTIWEFHNLSSKDTVPSWWVQHQSIHLNNLTTFLVEETLSINSIFPKNNQDVKERAKHIQKAIETCFKISQHVDYLIDILSMKKVCNLGESIEIENLTRYEISLLKGLRKSDKERFA